LSQLRSDHPEGLSMRTR